MKIRNKGITLIALVITIIILLILAGISISSLTGSGLFGRAKESKEKSLEAQIKEEIETTIMNIQIEEISKGNNVTLELLEKELPNKLKDIEAQLEDNGEYIEGEYKDYSYTIDKDLKVEMNGLISGEKPTITFSVNTTDIGATEVIITATATVSDGTITKIIKPDGTESSGAETTYTVNKSGSYVFKAISSTGRKGKNTIDIKNIKPSTPIITINEEERYPTLTLEGFKGGKIIVDIQFDDSEFIKNYYSEDNGTTWQIYSGTIKTNATKIMAKSVIEESNIETEVVSKEASVIDITAGIPLVPNCYDNKFDTFSTYGLYGSLFKIDSECWGKYISVYCSSSNGGAGALFFGTSKENFNDKGSTYLCDLPESGDMRRLSTRSMLIPDGTYWGGISGGRGNEEFYIYEMWCSERNLSGNEYSNENLPY